MKVQVFDLDFSRWEMVLLSLIPACINLCIFAYVIFALEKTKTTSYFSLFVLALGLWQVTDGMVHLSRTEVAASEWVHISELIILLPVPFGLQFIFSLTKGIKKRWRWGVPVLLYVPCVISFFLIEFRMDEYTLVPSDSAYWVANPKTNAATLGILIWISMGALLMLALLWRHFIKTKGGTNERNQALLLAGGLTFPVLGGILCEILFPLFLGIDDIPVTVPLLTIFSLTSIVAIRKFNMLNYSLKRQWRRVVETMSEGIAIIDLDKKIKYANSAFCSLLGYNLEEIEGIAATEFVDSENADLVKERFRDRKMGISGRYTLQLRRKDGDKINVLISGSPYYDRKGKVTGAIGLFTNITGIKETERRLSYSEARLKQAQEVAHVGSWELNFSTRKSIWSEEACRMYGLPVEEGDKQNFETWLRFIHPEDLQAVRSEIERAQRYLSNSSFRHRIIRRDGTIRHIHSVSRFEFNESGSPTGLFGVCYDLSEAFEKERALTESEENMRTFINESQLGIYFIDPSTKRIQYSNPALCDMLGYSVEEFMTMPVYNFINHSKEDVDERMKRVVAQKKVNNDERQWVRKDGTVIHVLLSCFYRRQNGTETIYVAAQNITSRKNAEEKLKVTNRELETFIYKASHDIRGPLASISGLVHVSRLEEGDGILRKYIEMIGETAQKLDYNLVELIKAMRIKDVSIFEDRLEFNKVIDDIIGRYSHFPGFDNLNIIKKVDADGEFVSNKGIIETIIQNLFENAIKYQNKNNSNCFVKVTISGNKDGACIILEDNGIGIAPEFQSMVFDMYFRANMASKGSGLGLYLVKKGVDKLRGKISLESMPGLGSTFKVILPGG